MPLPLLVRLTPLLLAGGCFIGTSDRDRAMDRDRDGFVAWQVGGQDCDDADADVYPGAPESCLDDIDSDCDGRACWERVDVYLDPDDTWAEGAEVGAALVFSTPLGDFDGDGVVELVLSQPGAEQGAGVVTTHALPLSLDGLDPTADPDGLYRGPPNTQGALGTSAGDLDGDGDPELIVSSAGPDGGIAFVLDAAPPPGARPDNPPRLTDPGSRSTPDPAAGEQRFGRVQALGDGVWLLTAPGHDGGGTGRGQAYVLSGVPSGEQQVSEAAVAILQGAEDDDRLGSQVASTAPDLNGDGRRDPLVNAPGYRPDLIGSASRSGSTGGAFGFTGALSGVLQADQADVLLTSAYDNALLARPGHAGDINGDGYDDLGLYYGSGAGRFLVFLGPLEGTYYPESADLQIIGDAGDTVTFGFAASWDAVGDLDEDGFDDVIVGAPEEGTGGLGDGPLLSGAHYLFLGPLTGVLSPDHARARWMGAHSLGQQASSAVFDADGDGRRDLLLGSEGSTDPDAGEGRAGEIQLVPDAFGGLGW